MMSIGSVRGLPEFHIHGDYHALNLRFSSQDVSAVLGLDASRWEKRIIELAYGLFYFSALQWRAYSSLTLPLMQRCFITARPPPFTQAPCGISPPRAPTTQILAAA